MKRSLQDIVCDLLVGTGLIAVIGLGSASLWYDAQTATSDETSKDELLPPLEEEWDDTTDEFTEEDQVLTPMQEVPMIEDTPEVTVEEPDTLSTLPSTEEPNDTAQHHVPASETIDPHPSVSTKTKKTHTQQQVPVTHTAPTSKDTLTH